MFLAYCFWFFYVVALLFFGWCLCSQVCFYFYFALYITFCHCVHYICLVLAVFVWCQRGFVVFCVGVCVIGIVLYALFYMHKAKLYFIAFPTSYLVESVFNLVTYLLSKQVTALIL